MILFSFETNWLKYSAMRPSSSRFVTSKRTDRSPSPALISLSIFEVEVIGRRIAFTINTAKTIVKTMMAMEPNRMIAWVIDAVESATSSRSAINTASRSLNSVIIFLNASKYTFPRASLIRSAMSSIVFASPISRLRAMVGSVTSNIQALIVSFISSRIWTW